MGGTKNNNGRKNKAATSFPHKLMQILTTPAYSDIVTFLPCGKAFKILKPKDFTNRILPVHFKEAKYSSFKRKLHRWGFERRREAAPEDSSVPRSDWFGSEETFYHEHFVQGQSDLIEKMGGLNNKNESNKAAALPATTKPTSISASPKPDTKVTTVTMATTTTTPKPIPATTTTTAATPIRRRSATDAFNVINYNNTLPLSLPPRKRLRAVETSMASAAMAASGSAAVNAAIEAEVARRLRQQMAAAQLSKQRAILMMEQQRRQHQQQQQQAAAAARAAVAAFDQREILKNVIAKYTAATQASNNKHQGTVADIGSPLVRLPSEKNVMPRTA